MGTGTLINPVTANRPDSLVTETEFVHREYRIWGEDYIDDLYDRGYVPEFVSGIGWRWVYRP